MRGLLILLLLSPALFIASAIQATDSKIQHSSEIAKSDSTGLGDFSFDALLEAMEEVESNSDNQNPYGPSDALGMTLAYLDRLFEESIDPNHPQVLGGTESVMKTDFEAIPKGDIPINVSEFTMPIRGRLSSRFGYRRHSDHHHNGIDIAITKSDTVKAAFPGNVVMTGNDKHGYGYYIVMAHPNGLHTLYAHLDKFLTVPGEKLEAGTPVAIGGKSGNSTGRHLHFEIRYHSLPVDPARVINLRTGKVRDATFLFNKEEILEARQLSKLKANPSPNP